MITKLTLSMDPEIIRKAKVYAQKQNRSLSNLIETYLRSLVEDADSTDLSLNAELRNLRGAFNLGEENDLSAVLAEKYLKDD